MTGIEHLGGQIDAAGSDALHGLMAEVAVLCGCEVPGDADERDLLAAALAAATNAASQSVAGLAALAAGSLRGELSARCLASTAAGLLGPAAQLYLLAERIEALAGD